MWSILSLLYFSVGKSHQVTHEPVSSHPSALIRLEFALPKIYELMDLLDKAVKDEITPNESTNNELTKWIEAYEADRKTLIKSSNRTFRDLILLGYGIFVVTYLVASGLFYR